MKNFLLFALTICLLALAASIRSWLSLNEEKNRLLENQRALLLDIDFYRTKDSLSVASVEKLTLTKTELEKYNSGLAKTVRELGVKIKRLEAAGTTTVRTDVDITAPIVKDIVVKELKPFPIHRFEWRDRWVSISGITMGEKVNCRVQSIDTLVQVVHRVPKRFWFIKYGTKAIRQEIISRNPHSQIIYTEYIELKK